MWYRRLRVESSRAYRSAAWRRSTPCARIARVWLLVLRALLLSLAFELSGFASAIVEMNEASADCCSDCPLEAGGKECPPGCPYCHCAHGGVALPPAGLTAVDGALDRTANVVALPKDAVLPRPPTLPGVYRPPRPSSAIS